MSETKKQLNPLMLYNTAERRLEEFKSAHFKVVKMYACGPTVYNTPTIANLRTYINIDILHRWLKYLGYKIQLVENITDIEDKIIKAVKKAGLDSEDKKEVKKYTKKYEDEFVKANGELNILKPTKSPHATDKEVISEMIKIIERLLKKGFAYAADDGVYFSLSKFKEYGKLSKVNLSGIKEGARVDIDEYDKENARDFALWKFKKAGEPSWKAPFGEGRPGWHIECSAMALKYLGDEIDIHAGGVDLIFPHHENEIAQSESFTGKKFAHYWFHPEHMMIEGERMGKSLGNFYTLDDLSSKFKVEPLALRMLSLISHYRERLNFTHSNIQDAQNTLNNLREFTGRLKQTGKPVKTKSFDNVISKAKEDFIAAMNNDLSMPKAMAVLFDFIKKANTEMQHGKLQETKAVYDFIIDLDKILGLGLDKIKTEKIPNTVLDLAKKREQWRTEGYYEKADEYRKKIEKAGYLVEDTTKGPVLRKK